MILRDRPYLDYLRTQPCVITGLRGSEQETVDPCHISTAGKGIKSPDNEALPILHRFHAMAHNSGEVSMLRTCAPDWLMREAFKAYARQLYEEWKQK